MNVFGAILKSMLNRFQWFQQPKSQNQNIKQLRLFSTSKFVINHVAQIIRRRPLANRAFIKRRDKTEDDDDGALVSRCDMDCGGGFLGGVGASHCDGRQRRR